LALTILILVLFIALGCSKKETYIVELGKSFEMGVDILEGTYKVESCEDTSKDNDDFTSVIGD